MNARTMEVHLALKETCLIKDINIIFNIINLGSTHLTDMILIVCSYISQYLI